MTPPSAQPWGERLCRILFLHDGIDPLTHWIDGAVLALVCVSALAAWLDLAAVVPAPAVPWLRAMDWLATVALTVEYLARLALVPHHPRWQGHRFARLAWARSPAALLELVGVLPAWIALVLPVSLGLLRLVRILRAVPVLEAFAPAWTTFQERTAGRAPRARLFAALFDPASGPLHDIIERMMMTAVVLSTLTVTLETVASLEARYHAQFLRFDRVIGLVFLVEFLLRLFAVTEAPAYARPFLGRLRFLLTPGALIDLVALAPLVVFLTGWDLGLLPVLRLFRMMKLTRYSRALSLIVEVVRDEWATLQASLVILVLLTTLASTGVYFAERAAQPELFSSIPAAMYWAVVTLTSIGYGDIYPVTDLGRMMTMVLAVVSLGMVALPAGIVATAFTERLRQSIAAPAPRDAQDPRRILDFVASLSPEERALLQATLALPTRPDEG